MPSRARALFLLAGAIGATLPFASAACGDHADDDALPNAADGGTDSPLADLNLNPNPALDQAGPVADVLADVEPPLAESKEDPCRGIPVNIDHGYVPTGMCASFIGSLSGVRQLTFASNGDLFATTGTAIHLLRDDDKNGFFTSHEIHEWAQTSGAGIYSNNCHIDVTGGFVYAGSEEGVKRFAYSPGALTGGLGEDVVVGQPKGGHTRRTVRVYDGWLYVHSGSLGNVGNETSTTEYDTKRSLIMRFDLSKRIPGQPFQWDIGERFTVGVRNANGFARNEITKKMYAVVNGIDDQAYKGVDVHNDNPGEQVVELAAGRKYGYPFCFTAQRVVDNGTLIAPGTQLFNVSFPNNPHNDAWCAATSSTPTTFLQAHSAPLDITFFDKQAKGALPEKWRGGAFIAMHGSGNRDVSTGTKIVWQPFNPDGTSPMPTSTATTTTFPYQVVFGGGNYVGPRDGGWTHHSLTGDAGVLVDAGIVADAPRPAGVAISPIDGALYVASDQFGTLYRVGLKKL